MGCYAAKYLGNASNPLCAKVFALMRRAYSVESSDQGRSFVLKSFEVQGETGDPYDVTNWYMSGLWTEGYVI